MTQEEIKEALEDIDEEVLLTIIDCCKELVCNGTQMYLWDKYSIMDIIDDVMKANGHHLTRKIKFTRKFNN